MPRPMGVDRWLFLSAAALLGAGFFLVGSASHYVAMSAGKWEYHFVAVHFLHFLLGGAACAAALAVPYGRLSDRRLVIALVSATILALLVVRSMPAVGGAHRWIRLGPLGVQPSEFAKLVAILFVAWLLAGRETEVNDPRRVALPCAVAVGPMVLLTLLQPDLGTAFMLSATVLVMIFVAGIRWKSIAVLAGVGLVGLAGAVVLEPYRLRRIQTFLNPTADLQGAGFQLAQSLIALGRGGLSGVGLGQGQQQAFYLPAAHTDFIFSVAGEEAGLLGTALLLGGFLIVFWRGMRAALRAPDRFGFYLALGITSLVVLQALIHMGVCSGLLPTKGLPLPLVSYGGSSLVVTMASMGVLLNVSQHSN